MATVAPTFGTDEILWYDNGKGGDAGYALANPNGKTWTNNAATGLDRKIWAVAVPISVRYEGDVQPGMDVVGFAFAESAGEESKDTTAVGIDSAQEKAMAARRLTSRGLANRPNAPDKFDRLPTARVC